MTDAELLAGFEACTLESFHHADHVRVAWIILHRMPFPDAVRKDTAMLAILPSLVVIAVSILFILPARARPIVAMIVLVAVISELWEASSGWNPVLPQERSYPSTPLIERLQDIVKRTPRSAPFRIVGFGPALFPNAQAIYGFEDIRAHDPMANGRYVGVLRVVTGYNTGDYNWGYPQPPQGRHWCR